MRPDWNIPQKCFSSLHHHILWCGGSFDFKLVGGLAQTCQQRPKKSSQTWHDRNQEMTKWNYLNETFLYETVLKLNEQNQKLKVWFLLLPRIKKATGSVQLKTNISVRMFCSDMITWHVFMLHGGLQCFPRLKSPDVAPAVWHSRLLLLLFQCSAQENEVLWGSRHISPRTHTTQQIKRL